MQGVGIYSSAADRLKSPNSPTKKGQTSGAWGDALPQGQLLSLKNVQFLPSANAGRGLLSMANIPLPNPTLITSMAI